MNIRKFSIPLVAIVALLLISATIDLDNLFNYTNQEIPNYITKDNTNGNNIDDKIATLGRVLFYDKKLSSNETISCSSCHQQDRAFADPAVQSIGLNGGLTGRHSMRLINARFGDEVQFFWDKRANTLEQQTTMPIQDHVEMGYSGTNGDPDINDLITLLNQEDYYQTLFTFAFGDSNITENRMQLAIAQFVRSIQSFDSRFDEGLTMVNNNINAPFPNYTNEENLGKTLFLDPPPAGGAGCAGCHRAPEFDIDPLTLNNGVIAVAGDPSEIDLTNTRAPSLRNVFNPDGSLNGPLMHNGNFTTMLQVVNHYNVIPNNPENTNLDPRLLGPGGQPQNLNLSEAEKNAIVAFLQTLTGNDVYTNEKWSDPFDPDGSIEIIGGPLGITEEDFKTVAIYPNPTYGMISLDLWQENFTLTIYDVRGQLVKKTNSFGTTSLDISTFPSGLYLVNIEDESTHKIYSKKIIKK